MSPSPEHDEERVAIITGASQGIGAGLTKAYRDIGHAVIATSRSIGPSEDPGIVTVEGDIADPDTARRVVDEAVERFGRIDTLINNAGIYIGKPFTEYTLEDFNALIAVNLAGFFHMTTRAIKQMVDHGHGHVVNISTTLVEQADSSRPAALSVLTKGGPGRGYEIAGHRVRLTWPTGKCRVSGCYQNANTRRELLCGDGHATSRWPGWRDRGRSRRSSLSRVGADRDWRDLAYRRRPERRTLMNISARYARGCPEGRMF